MLLCNKKRSESQSQNSISKKDQHIFKPFFMPLIVFIKTVGISQKKYYKLYLIFVLAENLHTLCNLSCSPHDPYYYETNSPFLCTLTTEKKSVLKITETRPKKSFFFIICSFHSTANGLCYIQ